MIRQLAVDDAAAFAELRREALLDSPLAFLSSPADDLAAQVSAVREQLERAPESVIFGVFDEKLVGSLGLYRDRHSKASHKVHIWGMYVTPTHRRRGHAAALLRAALEHAESITGVSWVHLSVSSTAVGPRRLYESTGFRGWGTEPDAIRHEGEAVSELHMALQL